MESADNISQLRECTQLFSVSIAGILRDPGAGLLWTRFTGKILVFSFENAYISMRLGLLSTYAERFHRKRIDLKTLLKVDENENAHILSD